MGSFRTILLAAACALQIGGARADNEIVLQRGKDFSVYAASSCRRADASNVDLMLACEFHNQRADFYLKEFQNMSAPDIRAPADASVQIERMMQLVLAGIDRNMGERVRLYGGSGNGATIFNFSGFRFKTTEDAKKNAMDSADKRVLVRTHTYMGHLGYETAVLVVISDFDPSNLKVNRGVPDEVMTMFTSLDLVRDRLPPL